MQTNGMIDVTTKKETNRIAKARAFIRLNKEIMSRVKNNQMPKGNVLESSRVAGVLAAKKTSELLPLCHNLGLDYAGVDFHLKNDGIIIESLVKSRGKTGVEMEAMVCCSIAALTIYDMCKMFSKDIEIEEIFLLEKSGGKSGVYKRKNN